MQRSSSAYIKNKGITLFFMTLFFKQNHDEKDSVRSA